MIKITICAAVILLSMGSCQNNADTTNENTTTMESTLSSNSPSLKSQLDARKEASNLKADEKTKTDYAANTQKIAESDLIANALQVGDQAKDFTLKNALGKEVRLYDALKNGPVVLTWYRGGWCPYCNLTLNALQKELPKFQAAGATLFALSPEVPDSSLSTKEKNSLNFEVLSDLHNKVGKEYGIVYKLTDEVSERFNKNFGLNKQNADESNELPLAATYIINKEGKITYAYLDADYRNRAEPIDITKALQEIKGK